MSVSNRSISSFAALFLSGVLGMPAAAHAQDQNQSPSPKKDPVVLFSQTVVEGLAAREYKIEPGKQSLVTLQNASGFQAGRLGLTTFMFGDFDQASRYIEGNVRVSGSKLTGKKLAAGPVADVVGSYTVEVPKGIPTRHQYGAGVNLNVPGFPLLTADAFVRDDRAQKGATWHTTLVWATKEWKRVSSEGFIDLLGREGQSAGTVVSQPRVLATLWKSAHAMLRGGVEVDIRRNKFGIEGVNEVVPQAVVSLSLSK